MTSPSNSIPQVTPDAAGSQGTLAILFRNDPPLPLRLLAPGQLSGAGCPRGPSSFEKVHRLLCHNQAAERKRLHPEQGGGFHFLP